MEVCFSYYTFLIPSEPHFSARIVEVRIFLRLASNLVCLRLFLFSHLYHFLVLIQLYYCMHPKYNDIVEIETSG